MIRDRSTGRKQETARERTHATKLAPISKTFSSYVASEWYRHNSLAPLSHCLLPVVHYTLPSSAHPQQQAKKQQHRNPSGGENTYFIATDVCRSCYEYHSYTNFITTFFSCCTIIMMVWKKSERSNRTREEILSALGTFAGIRKDLSYLRDGKHIVARYRCIFLYSKYEIFNINCLASLESHKHIFHINNMHSYINLPQILVKCFLHCVIGDEYA